MSATDPSFSSSTLMRSSGLKVYVWTVNDESRMRELLEAGVAGFITDRPDLLHRVRQRRR
jgi:glycerophosphoryl diester phosphodiesterase